MTQHSQTIATDAPPPIREVSGALRGLRVRARRLLVTRRVAFALAAFLGASLSFAVIDFFLRFPPFIRVAALVIGAIIAVLWVRRVLLPAVRFKPALSDLALRVERLLPKYRGILASAVDFTAKAQPHATATERALIERAVTHAGEIVTQVGGVRAGEVLRPKPAHQSSLVSALALVVVLAIALITPGHFAIGAERLFLPFTGQTWPKRTDVADATENDFHALGESLTLRAALMRSPSDAGATDVSVRYRLIKDGKQIRERRELMTWQERPVEGLRGGDRQGSGELFERLIEPQADALEYRFETADDETAWRRIALIEPPRVLGATATITPPEYARDLDDAAHATVNGADMGPGTDERAIATPSLAGSRVSMTVTVNKEVEIPESASLILGEDAQIERDGTVWAIGFTLEGSVRLPLTLVDSYGIESVEDAVFRFEALLDAEPTATITDPTADESVLPTAVVTVTGEGRDDVGLAWVELERTRYAPATTAGSEPSGPGGALEPVGEPTTVARIDPAGDLTATVSAEIDLAVLGVSPGDEVHVRAIARDIYAVPGQTREPTRSTVRVLRVLSEIEFIDDIQDQLSDIRQSAIRIDEQQLETEQLTRERGATRPTTRSQGQVTKRIARQQEVVQRLRERVERNALIDSALRELLSQAERSLERAGESSVSASQELGEAAERAEREQRESGEPPDPDDGELTEQEQRDVEQQQEQVRAELAQLIEQLDRGQDNWVVRNTLENALGEQQSLQEQTEQLGAQTAGRSVEELTEDERSELERIVSKQLDLQEKLRELVESLRDREQELKQDDPGAAAALQRAAETADEQELLEAMQRAAEQASQNQQSNAAQDQEQAAEALQEMLEDLQSGERAREEALERALKSIIESIEGLLNAQRRELESLANAVNRQTPLDRLSQGMIDVNRNTLGVRDLAFDGGSALAPIFSLLDNASDAQVRAIRELREAEPSPDEAREHETQSLDLLTRALERAEEAQEQAQEQQDRQKIEQLKKAYFEALEAQAALRDEAAPFAEAETLSRRDRVLVRRMGEPQRDIGAALKELREEVAELADAKVFDYAHDRIETLIERSAVQLESSEPKNSVRTQNSIIRMIEGLIESLEDAQQKPGEEGEQQQAGGGGGQGGSQGEQPLIPPGKELRLLRDLQIQLTEETSDLSAEPGIEREAVVDLGRAQRELLELGEDLVRRVTEQGAPGGPGQAPGGMELPLPDPAGGESDHEKGENIQEKSPESSEQASPGEDSPKNDIEDERNGTP